MAVGVTTHNGITAGRLLLALTVVISHSFAVTGHLEPLVAESGQLSVGFLAVVGFFGLSGWLLAQSRRRNDRAAFLRNRILRVYPAYWLALVLGAAVAVAFGSSAWEGLAYVATNVSIVVPGADSGAAFAGYTVNGSLWTLAVEVSCYIALAMCPVHVLRPVAVGLVAAFVALWPLIPGAETMLLVAFSAGATVTGVPAPRTALLLLATAAVAFTLTLTPVAVVATAIGALGMVHLPFRWRTDLSYGAYVFAYPIQRSLVGVGIDEPMAVAILTIAIVLPLAWLSWTFVESPAIRLRHRRWSLGRQTGTMSTSV